jgi:hypothetical protein
MGLREGEAIGAAKGRAEGESALRQAIVDLCEAYDVAVSDTQKASLATMSLDELNALRAHIKTERRWS